ncbi:phosphate ABC transporter ATP-binding protein [Candidatus Bipolaricaulota bacterium]|nr:phosphate ABC transporter ATP-binding protein [Candidatus Bipolaricaulota bacterium]
MDLPNQTAVEIRNLDVYYGEENAIEDVSLDILRKKVTALIGPSGCGKSTLLRSINRMNDLIDGAKVEGIVKVDGNNVYSKGLQVSRLRQKVGQVFQKPNPFPKSVYDNVAFGPRAYKHHLRKEKGGLSSLTSFFESGEKSPIDGRHMDKVVKDSLEQAALLDEVEDKLHKSAMDLSGGQQQRLCIARCLATKPEIILMDEPTSSLDPISAGRIEDLIEDLSTDYTVLIVTHNMQQAARISDKTALLWLGELVEMSETEELFENPEKELTEKYITGRVG